MINKILIVLPSFYNGGTNTCLRSLLPVLKDKRFDIDIFAITNEGPNKEFALKYANVIGFTGEKDTKCQKKTFRQRLALGVKQCKKLLCKIKIDISSIVFKRVAHQLEMNKYDLIICYQEGITTHFCSYFKNTPKIAWIHCDYERYLKTTGKSPENKLYRDFSKVVCVSEYTREKFLKYVNSCKEVIALHNIIDFNLIVERAKQKIIDEKYLNDSIRIVSVGRINEVKRFSEIPYIVKQLKEKGLTNFRWYIIGDGDKNETDKLKFNISKMKVNEVVLLGNKDNPYPYMRQADLFVSTSISEACPCVLSEAKVLGVPIVATDFGSVYEFITNGEDGLISSITDMAECIYRVLTNRGVYEKIKDNLSTTRYDNNVIIDKLFNEVLVI